MIVIRSNESQDVASLTLRSLLLRFKCNLSRFTSPWVGIRVCFIVIPCAENMFDLESPSLVYF